MLVPIACRFVPYDQWLVTHLDDKAKVKQIKLWILSKCNLVQSHGPHSHRPVSPIVFASSARSRSSVDSQDDGYNEDDEFSDQDLPPAPSKHVVYPNPTPPSPPRTHPLVDQYTLLSFSTGSLLEDGFALSWYNLRPYELLEMHPVGFVAPLQRDVLAEYILPYFQAKVRVLRSVWNHKSGRFEAPDLRREHTSHSAMDKLANTLETLSTKSSPSHSEKKRKTKADWKTRCLVINQGIFSLCKEHVTNPPLQQFPLSAMTALRGADALGRVFSIVTQPRIVCIKFRARSASLAGVTPPPPSSPTSPVSEESKINVREPHPDMMLDSKQKGELENPDEDPDDACKGQGEWVVLDLLDDHAFSSVLRILHRQASQPISSSFVPSSSVITVGHTSVASPIVSSISSYDTVPYPEWRIDIVKNARNAGMGDVGKAMAWVNGLGNTEAGNIGRRRQAFSRYKNVVPSEIYCGADDESEEESEMEWEGWMRDLKRQSQIRQEKESARRTATSTSRSRPLPEVTASGLARVGSGSLSMSQAAGSSQYPNGRYRLTEQGRSVSTVSVGIASVRRRSSTVFGESGETRERLGGMRTRTVSHARSSSNLKVSSSPYGSDVAEAMASSSPSKRQSGFMRGMTLRAGKLVRGLESAIDFVDEKTVE